MGGVGSLCDDFPDDKGVFLFSRPKVIAQPARPMIDPSMSLRFMNLLSSHSWFMDVLLTPNMIIIGFDRSPGNQLQDVSNGAGSNEDPFDWSRC